MFGLDSEQAVSLFRFLFPGYTLVAYDDRGTGESGLLDCPARPGRDHGRPAAHGRRRLRRRRSARTARFYSTAEHAEDLEAVRQALGFDKIALFGVSYGTKLAMAYALAHPDHVERLLLDSVLPPELPDPYSANVMRNLPGDADAFCSDGELPRGDEQLRRRRRRGRERARGEAGRGQGAARRAARRSTQDASTASSFLSTLLDADLSPGLAAELPGGRPRRAASATSQPLLRLALPARRRAR